MKARTLLIASLLFLVAAGLVGALLWRGNAEPPLEYAPLARPGEDTDVPEEVEPAGDPTHGLPLHHTIENVPEVPEAIRGPSPPIEE